MLTRLEQQLQARPGLAWADGDLEVARAAVAAVLDAGGHLLFIRRSECEGDPWSGHMAFPGGRVDPVDSSLRAAAERETAEEVGLDLSGRGRLLGALDEVGSPVRTGPARLVISPFVYALDARVELCPNHEVASVHWLSLDRLAAGEGRGSFELSWQGERWEMPRVDIDGVRIWGLTLYMLDDMLARIGGVVSPPVRVLPG